MSDMRTVVLTRDEYLNLKKDSAMLNALLGGGVDNWEGYDDALDRMEEVDRTPGQCAPSTVIVNKAITAKKSVRLISEEELKNDIISHIADVQNGLRHIANLLVQRGNTHDHTKISTHNQLEWFYKCLQTGFEDDSWWRMHKAEERHHLKCTTMEDITLVDIMEHLVDCAVAGIARNGKDGVYSNVPPGVILQSAFKNTFDQLLEIIRVDEGDEG